MNAINNILSQVAGLPVKEAQPAKVVNSIGVKPKKITVTPQPPVVIHKQEPGTTPETTPEPLQYKVIAEGKGLIIHDYSEKAFAVTGQTKENKDSLMQLGGKYQPFLKVGKGFIFSKKNLDKVLLYIG